jgi:formamidopyrimidine-DNA glycosylase
VPELPEVETVVRELRPQLVGQRILSVRASKKTLRKPWATTWAAKIRGRLVQAIRRRGKWIVVDFEGGRTLVIHLGMTGRLMVHPAAESVAAHTHLVFALEDGGEMRFNDIRRFGSATLFEDSAALERFFAKSRLGPEPFALKSDSLQDRLAATRRCLKAVLLDQTVVAGVGNIYADESLFEARLRPTRLGHDVNELEAERLRKAIVKVLNRAVARRGSSIRNYVGGSGLKGRYQEVFRVYGRTGKPCLRCRTPIARLRLAGRSTHYCPSCQGSSRQQAAGSGQ